MTQLQGVPQLASNISLNKSEIDAFLKKKKRKTEKDVSQLAVFFSEKRAIYLNFQHVKKGTFSRCYGVFVFLKVHVFLTSPLSHLFSHLHLLCLSSSHPFLPLSRLIVLLGVIASVSVLCLLLLVLPPVAAALPLVLLLRVLGSCFVVFHWFSPSLQPLLSTVRLSGALCATRRVHVSWS